VRASAAREREEGEGAEGKESVVCSIWAWGRCVGVSDRVRVCESERGP
jgi:hypothetical protein